MTDLRALLGERYDVVMQAACGCDGTRTPHCYECSDSTWDRLWTSPACLGVHRQDTLDFGEAQR